MEWTQDQEKVIYTRNKNLLVSAAAGSGKTAVLVERILKLITDKEHPVDIDRLIVVTFTKAAAAEMRERVRKAIETCIEEEQKKGEPDPNLIRQSSLIHNAMITTIDSFCLYVVRNHFGEINIEPNFRIADTGEIKLLEQDVLDGIFEDRYLKKEEKFLQLIDAYADARSDSKVRDMVLSIYHKAASAPWPREWMSSLAHSYQVETEEEVYASPAMQMVMAELLRLAREAYQDTLVNQAKVAENPYFTPYVETANADLESLKGWEEIRDFTGLKAFYDNLNFGRLKTVKKTEDPELSRQMEAFKNARDEIKKSLNDGKKKYLNADASQILDQLKRMRPMVEALTDLALALDQGMTEAKKKKRMVEFSDMEHYALSILVDPQTKLPTATARQMQEQYQEIMIDEYQDSNQVQETILGAIARDNNRFMVGDVKQSIYRFRQACPELFMEKYQDYGKEDGGENELICLSQNFRSRDQVLDFTNDIFYKIMGKDLGEVAYDQAAALYGNQLYEAAEGREAELLLVDPTISAEETPGGEDTEEKEKEYAGEKQEENGDHSKEEEEVPGAHDLEAYMIAKRIQELMGSMTLLDKDSEEPRPLHYRDIVILLRSVKGWGTDFVNVLSSCGIPAHVESSVGYFQATEVQTVIAFLKLLDNPYQDIPMAAVLHSPIGGMDDEELAEIAVRKEKTFAEKALAYLQEAQEGPAAAFYRLYQNLRDHSHLPIHELLNLLLQESGYSNYVASLPSGQRRLANLQELVEKAIAYEKTSYKGLFHFVRYLEQLNKYDVDFGEADITGENADVVRIMTIHKSKGLEFPVVFVSGLSKQFNETDNRSTLVLHDRYGLGLTEISGHPRVKRKNLIRETIAETLRRETLGEELRVLYVALTRAKEKLILTGSLKHFQEKLSKYTGNVKPMEVLPFETRDQAKCYLDWVLPAILSYPDRYDAVAEEPSDFVKQEEEKQLLARLDYHQTMEKIGAADLALVEQIKDNFTFQYPYQAEVTRHTKYSVSEIKHQMMEERFAQLGEEELVARPDFATDAREGYVPTFLRTGEEEMPSQAGVSQGALRGTAVHRVMECLDFVKILELDCEDAQAVRAFTVGELKRMTQAGDLSTDMRKLIRPGVIEGFIQHPVARRMAEAAARGQLFKEKPFVMDYQGSLVQGIVDVFWLEDGQIVLLDYKTDRVGEPKELELRYKTQLDIYGMALSNIYSVEEKVEAKEKLIYSFCFQEVYGL